MRASASGNLSKQSGRLNAETKRRQFAVPKSVNLRPPYPPMEALLVEEIPTGPNWQYEPKWDGFRCLVFKEGDAVELRAKSGKPLGR